jgi:hypothetical protein
MSGIWDVLNKALAEGDAETFRAQPFTAKPKLWLSSDENFDLLIAYYKITHMYDVPIAEIDEHTKVGVPNPAAAEQLFAKFML